MARTDLPQRLEDFASLTNTISMYTPLHHTAKSPTILLHTWMNAAPTHIYFYCRKWLELLPDARLVVIQGTVPDIVYRTSRSQKRNVSSVLSALRAEPDSPLYMHLFSNAGANSAAHLLRAYRETSSEWGDLLPLRGLVLDSTPSDGSYEAGYAGMSYQVPQHPKMLYYLGILLVHALLLVAFGLKAVTGKLDVLSQSNKDLNDSTLISTSVPRLYCYSREDLLVKWEDIEHHATVAVSKGWPVSRAVFQGTAHCRHAKGREEIKYWGLVRDTVSLKMAI